ILPTTQVKNMNRWICIHSDGIIELIFFPDDAYIIGLSRFAEIFYGYIQGSGEIGKMNRRTGIPGGVVPLTPNVGIETGNDQRSVFKFFRYLRPYPHKRSPEKQLYQVFSHGGICKIHTCTKKTPASTDNRR